MDNVGMLSECRKLLRSLECDIVTDASDQNLYEILIQSSEKKITLLNWLFQHLFRSNQDLSNSFESLTSMFMSRKELTNFLQGSMPESDQFNIWKLVMSTVYGKKIRKDTNKPSSPYDYILSGKLLDNFVESWNQKVGKPAVPLTPCMKPILDIQTQVNITQIQLNNLNSPSQMSQEVLKNSNFNKKEDDKIQKLVECNYALDQILSQPKEEYPNSYELINRVTFIENLQKKLPMEDIKRNIIQLRTIMNFSTKKSSVTD